jgi:hypothetical protein
MIVHRNAGHHRRVCHPYPPRPSLVSSAHTVAFQLRDAPAGPPSDQVHRAHLTHCTMRGERPPGRRRGQLTAPRSAGPPA